jgi:ArsR family transcriptional regulator, arsenate/arsenite/antimonite-responsive transcriptional repressor
VVAKELTDLASSAVISGLAALAHETRLTLFRQLVRHGRGGESAGELARGLNIPPQTLSFHLKEMTHAGLLRPRREGRYIYYAVDFDYAHRLIAYLSDSCCADDDPSNGGLGR